jgi:hypothetical protein
MRFMGRVVRSDRHALARAARAAAAALLLLVALGGASAVSQMPRPRATVPTAGRTLIRLVHRVGGSEATAAEPRFRYLRKLDSRLQPLAARRPLQPGMGAVADREGVTLATGGGVRVDVYVRGDLDRTEHALRTLGMRVIAVDDRAPQRMVEGALPAGALAPAAALGGTRAIVATIPPIVGTGSVLSQGDAVLGGPAARALGPTGAGVQVGVISDSIDDVGGGIATSQSTGDLPLTVDDLADQPSATDEGRAMAEIVYDEAPGITHMAFASGTLGVASKASEIDDLVANGAKVIADDVSYPGEPFFQDDAIAQAVDRAKAAGVAYLSAAGNEADHSWEGTYAPVADPMRFSSSTEDSDPGPGIDTVQTVGTVPAGGMASIVLQWDEPWGQATTDLALDIYRIVGGVPTYWFTADSDNIASGIPEEYAEIPSTATVTYGVAIRRVAGRRAPFMKYVAFTDGSGTVSIEHPTDSGAIGPDASSATGALAVAATRWTAPTTPEFFTSRGPVTRLFDASGTRLASPETRAKPELAGIDGVSTSLGAFSPFYGTSAAAPAVAGIAALLRSANPTMPVDELYAILTNPANTLACTNATATLDCGPGLSLADRDVAQALDSTPPVIASTVSPAVPDGPAGWYTGPVDVSWTVSDGQSPTVDLTGCATADVADTAGSTLTCSATSAGGGSSASVSLKHDSTPPTALVVTGIAAQAYAPGSVPSASAIACSASDPTSGVTGCTVTGYDASLGSHVLTATATDGAGLTATATLGYSVAVPVAPTVPATPTPTTPTTPVPPPATAKPAAISRLAVAKGVTMKALARSGISLTLHVALPATRLVIELVATQGRRSITLARVTRRVGPGTAHLQVAIGAAARRRLAKLAHPTLHATVDASATGSRSAKLRSSAALRR